MKFASLHGALRTGDLRTGDLRTGEKIGYGLGDTASNLYWKTFEFFLLYFYTDVYGLSATQVATMFLVTRLWDAVNDPIVGYLADRTRTRWGRFRPYLIWMCVPLAVAGVAVMTTPDFSPTGKLVYAYSTYLLVMMAYTAINTPYGAMLGVLSPDSSVRTSAATFRFVAAFGGAIAVQFWTLNLVDSLGGTREVSIDGVVKPVPNLQAGFFWTMVVYGAVAVTLFVICFLSTRERVVPEVDRRVTLGSDLRFVLSSVLLHQIVLVGVFLTLGLGLGVRWPSAALLLLLYLGASAASLAANRWLHRDRPGRDDESSFRQDFRDLMGNRPWMVLFAYGMMVLMMGFVRNAAVLYYFKYFCQRSDLISSFLVSSSFASIAGMILAGTLAKRFGKRGVLSACSLGMAICYLPFSFLNADQIAAMFMAQLLAALLSGPIAVLLWSMYADAADYSEWRTHRRATGLIFSAATFSQKLGGSFGAASAAMLLGIFAYQPPVQGLDMPQSETTLLGLRMMMGAIPGGLSLIAATVLWFYPINQPMLSRIETDLRERKA